jgi:hypothetical protein
MLRAAVWFLAGLVHVFVVVPLLLLCQHCLSTAQASQNMWLWTGVCVLDIPLRVEECQLDWVGGGGGKLGTVLWLRTR